MFFFLNLGKSKGQKAEQRSTKDSKNQSYQSKFKASDLDKQSESNNASSRVRNHSDNIEDDKRNITSNLLKREIKDLLMQHIQKVDMMTILVLYVVQINMKKKT